MPSVIIDAGHGGRDYGATNGDRKEKDDALTLALMVGGILAENGVDVLYTRTEDVYDTPYEKAVIANNSGADYFLSIHRNASATPGSGTGIETLVYRDTGVAGELARNINANLAEIGFANRGVIERPGLVVLRRTQMPAVLVEVGFIDNSKDNELYDANLEAIAMAIADGFLETLGLVKDPGAEEEPVSDEVFYRVQVGAFKNRANAYRMLDRLLEDGYPGYVAYEDGYYKVQAGAFIYLDNAIKLEQELRRAGYSTYITTKDGDAPVMP
jgi:N-acetylmuramoyl-L-alanine amidase